MPSLIASIPSPSHGAFDVGPLTIHMYGLTLLVAILAATWLTAVRWRNVGGDPDLVLRVAVWGVAAGVVGARAYHVLTSWSEVPDPKWKGVLEIWNGGLGVWGGILLGTLVGVWIVRRAGASGTLMMDAVAPGPAARAGHRPHRQLVQPGAVRQADRPALGPRDRPDPPRRSTSATRPSTRRSSTS